jgi:hypothetical protein
VRAGQEAELWVDATKIQLFDPDDGRNLMVDGGGPAAVGAESAAEQPATGAGQPARGDEEPATSTRDEAS